MLLTFWGVRGSIPTPGKLTEKYGGNTACIEVCCGNSRVIFDAGSGIRNLGNSLLSQGAEQRLDLNLFLSHTHWDHIQGLPFFGPAYLSGTELKIWGSSRKGKELIQIIGGQMDQDYFPVNLSMLAADLKIGELQGSSMKVGNLIIEWQEQHFHPGGSLRFSASANGKKFVYASDVELNGLFASVSNDEQSRAMSSEYLEFIRGADLLIADGQYTEEEYGTKVGWGHTSMEQIIKIAGDSGVKRLAIFHHDPMSSDRKLDQLTLDLQQRFADVAQNMEIFFAREGVTLD